MQRLFCMRVSSFLGLASAVTLFAAEVSPPQSLVREALHAEASGVAARSEIIAASDEAPLVQSYLGNVRQAGKWYSLEEAAKRNAGDASLVAYDQQRRQLTDDFAGNVALADWCQTRGLNTQSGAHLLRALDFQPDNQAIRQRLGHVRVGVEWLAPEEAAAQRQRDLEQRDANEKWIPIVTGIRQRLLSKSQGRRNAAEKDLKKISDPLAIAAMESLLAGQSDEISQLLIDTLSAMSDPKASESLAKIAVLSWSQEVREAAAKRLGKRDPHSYIPQLLAAMRGPMQTRTSLTIEPDGRLLYRHAFLREGQEENEVAVLDTRIGMLSRSAANRPQAFSEAVERSRTEAMRREQRALAQRFTDQQINDRIAWVLRNATGEKQLASPQQWWDWWNQSNESFTGGAKPNRVAYQTSSVGIADPVSFVPPGSQSQSPSPQTRRECFVAGTKVYTATGEVSIEQIRVGDLVLTQNLDAGTLGYKPVVRTTQREPEKLVRVIAGQDTFDCTGGHLFWVLEQGWVKARDLKPGSTLHGAQASAIVTAKEEIAAARTFNLVVADDHNYFVGTGKLLTHDNSPRRPTTLIAPGVAAAK